MSHLAEVPLWAAIPVAALLVFGAGLTLIGAIGLLRLRSFYERIHAPTLGTSWGTGGVVLASMILFTALGERPVLHAALIGLFVTVTTPVTLMLLGRATLYRDRAEGRSDVPLMRADAFERRPRKTPDMDRPRAPSAGTSADPGE